MSRFLLSRKTAGGIDVQDGDVAELLSSISPSSLDEEDLAYGTYLFEYIGGVSGDRRAMNYSGELATAYARKFAGWLGYAFLNRANMSRSSKPMKALQEAMAEWVEAIPEMVKGREKPLSEFIPKEAARFVKVDMLDTLGARALREVRKDYAGSGVKKADGVSSLPIQFNPKTKQYEIPGNHITYSNRSLLKQLGFSWNGSAWFTDTLDQRALEHLPQAAKLQGVRRTPPPAPTKEPADWFFDDWLPGNIHRFSKLFTSYGRAENVPYEFKFILNGREVTVLFQRNINTVAEAVAEIESRYGGEGDRDGWLEAVASYRSLMSASGKAAIHAIDRANDLEHSHGSMMEHFPPGIRSWYPAFLDFKYTAGVWQMVKKLQDEDLRTIASEMMPLQDRVQRLSPKPTDYRTPKGLATEVAAQPGKANKKKMLKRLKSTDPEIYPEVVKQLEARGLFLE